MEHSLLRSEHCPPKSELSQLSIFRFDAPVFGFIPRRVTRVPECAVLHSPSGLSPKNKVVQAGAGSGVFDVNVMYVTGKVTSLEIGNGLATLRGTATVTGIGAGQDVPFTALVHAGGPGSRVKLEVSGLTFLEILVDGHISMD
jgi:hypothetical protein